jgi:type IV secretory pathway TrbL component
MNKKNQGIEVKLSVIAISAILVASLFVMGSSRFIPDAMAQNFTDQIGGATNQTGAAAGGATNQTGAAAGGATNQTGAAAGGATNQTGAAAGGATNATGAAAGGTTNATGAMVMIPQAAMTSMMDDLTTVRGAVDEGDTEAVDALDNVEMQLRTAAGLPPAETDTADEGDTDTADEGDTDTADEGDTDTADEGDTADEDTTDEDEGTTTGGGG